MMVEQPEEGCRRLQRAKPQADDNNWDLTALARYTPDANSDLEVRRRAQGALAEPV
jgi:hypothetical protein